MLKLRRPVPASTDQLAGRREARTCAQPNILAQQAARYDAVACAIITMAVGP
jgi:hypothetical protein